MTRTTKTTIVFPKIRKAKRIIITGDAGRGKTTLAQKLSQKLGIKHYSSDDFFWKVKFTQKEDKKKSIQKMSKLYIKESWIVEGATRRLLREGLSKADIIIYLGYRNILPQFWVLFRRSLARKEERFKDLLKLLKHVLFRKYGLGSERKKTKLIELLAPYEDKIIKLDSFKEIDKFIRRL